MAVFTFTPSNSARKEHAPRVIKAVYGDGYEQRTGDNLNFDLETWSLTFSVRTDTEGDQIEGFLQARAGIEAFTWTTPFGRTSLFVCDSWSRAKRACSQSIIEATFRQVEA